jgi:hypothetical protein
VRHRGAARRGCRSGRHEVPGGKQLQNRKVRPTMTASEAAAYLSTHGTPVFGDQLLAALNEN